MRSMFEVFFQKRNGVNNIMFKTKHYVPILKWKSAEKSALKALRAEDKRLMTPLIQFMTPQLTIKELIGKTDNEKFDGTISKFKTNIKKMPAEIVDYWGLTPVFVDFSLLLSELRMEAIETILKGGGAMGSIFIPVLYIDDNKEIKNLVKNYKNGLCLRLVYADLDNLSTLGKSA